MEKIPEHIEFRNLEEELHPALVAPARNLIRAVQSFERGLASMAKARSAGEIEDANEASGAFVKAHEAIERAARSAGYIDAKKTLPSEEALKKYFFGVHPQNGNLLLVRRSPPEPRPASK